MTENFSLHSNGWFQAAALDPSTESIGIICPTCRAIASQKTFIGLGGKIKEIKNLGPIAGLLIIKAVCNACHSESYWLKEKEKDEELLLYPKLNSEAPVPNPDMPDDVKQIFLESTLVLSDSPRASAALSRLAIDELTKILNPDGKNLNLRIGNLVALGLPIEVQQSLDIVRVVGNNAVHPGEIDLRDNKEMALSLLKLLNLIVDNRISQPKQIEAIYNSLPQGALDAINDRDGNTQNSSNSANN